MSHVLKTSMWQLGGKMLLGDNYYNESSFLLIVDVICHTPVDGGSVVH